MKGVKFYINSYNKLSIYTKEGEFKQIVEPKQIENFWLWLFAHQHRVGKVLDTKNLPNISHFLAYIGKSIVVNKTVFKIHTIEPVIGGVKVKLEDKNGRVQGINSEFGIEVIDLKRFEEWIVELIGGKCDMVTPTSSISPVVHE